MIKFSQKLNLVILIFVCLFTSALVVFAWSEPDELPPDGNVSEPLNVGAVPQEKAAGLWLNTGGAATGLIVEHGNVGIGTTEPAYKLDVVGVSRVTAANFNLHNTGSAYYIVQSTFSDPAETINFYVGVSTAREAFMGSISNHKFSLRTNNTNRLTIDTSGKVGIGTTEPSALLHISNTSTATSGSVIGEWVNQEINPSAESSALLRGIYGFSKSTTGNANNLTGSLKGLEFGVVHYGSGTLTTAIGSYTPINNYATGTITSSYGIASQIINSSTGTIGSAVGAHIYTPTNTSGTITNTYGIHIASQTAGTQTNTPFGIYQAGASDRNYFAGKVGIGTTEPGSKLHLVAGNMRIDNGWPEIILATTGTTASPQFSFYENTNTIGALFLYHPSAHTILPKTFRVGTYISGGQTYINYGTGTVGIALKSDGKVGIGTTEPSHILHITAQGRSTTSSWATSSDERIKTNINPINGGLDTIMQLKPVTFEYIEGFKQGNKELEGLQRGFIAQDVEKVIPEMVKIISETIGDQEIDDFRVLTNSDFVPLLISAFQELKAENDEFKSRLELIESSLDLCLPN